MSHRLPISHQEAIDHLHPNLLRHLDTAGLNQTMAEISGLCGLTIQRYHQPTDRSAVFVAASTTTWLGEIHTNTTEQITDLVLQPIPASGQSLTTS